MPDMLCSLVNLPAMRPVLDKIKDHGITIRRAHPWERKKLVAFIEKHFQPGWAEEAEIAFHHQPVTAFIAIDEENEIVGFSCYECTRKNYFGPTGVDEAMRGKSIGKGLFYAALRGLQSLGYTYAIIGGAGPVDFYMKAVDALVIPWGDQLGCYRLKEEMLFMEREE